MNYQFDLPSICDSADKIKMLFYLRRHGIVSSSGEETGTVRRGNIKSAAWGLEGRPAGTRQGRGQRRFQTHRGRRGAWGDAIQRAVPETAIFWRVTGLNKERKNDQEKLFQFLRTNLPAIRAEVGKALFLATEVGPWNGVAERAGRVLQVRVDLDLLLCEFICVSTIWQEKTDWICWSAPRGRRNRWPWSRNSWRRKSRDRFLIILVYGKEPIDWNIS